METPAIKVIQIDGKIGLKINHICIMMSPGDAIQLGHDIIIEAASLESSATVPEYPGGSGFYGQY